MRRSVSEKPCAGGARARARRRAPGSPGRAATSTRCVESSVFGTCMSTQRRTGSCSSARRVGEPRLERVERERRRRDRATASSSPSTAPGARRLRCAAAHLARACAELVRPLRAARLGGLAGHVVDLEQRQRGRRDGALLVGRAADGRRRHRLQRGLGDGLGLSGPSVQLLPASVREHALLREVLLETPEGSLRRTHLAEVLAPRSRRRRASPRTAPT